MHPEDLDSHLTWPLPNVWLGVTVEDQQRAKERIPYLLSIPAAVRFVSVEPMLGRVDLRQESDLSPMDCSAEWLEYLDWVICGCESGPGRRPTDIDWVRDLRDQCVAAGVPLFVKQLDLGNGIVKMPALDGRVWDQYPGEADA